MNKLKKSADAPQVLTNSGPALANQLSDMVQSGRSSRLFDSSPFRLFNHPTVKRQLLDDQHNKCAYCERMKNGDYGAVEHFRPKGTYYWLAYTWDNLLFSCSECNSSYKRDHFPLLDETARNIAQQDISREEPALLNPYADDPADHLMYEQFIVKPRLVDGNEDVRGRATIDLFKLNDRNDLLYSRQKTWHEYEKCKMQVSIIEKILANGVPDAERAEYDNLLSNAEDALRQMESDEAPFAGMIKYQVGRG